MEMQPIDLKNESNRLSTFVGWPVSFIVSPKSLAEAGFYYTKQTDKVKCAFCNLCICRWEFGDNAFDEHKRHNPICCFILNQDCGNIPIIEGIQLRGEFVENQKEMGQPIDIRGLGVRAHKVAFHLKYNSYCARLKTFRDWKNESQKPEDLAIAGFFFTGSNDEVRCYYCDGGLQNWELTDNPWVEHAKWFPNCEFLNLIKGEKFMDGNMVDRFNALLNRSVTEDTPSSSSQGVVSIHQTDDVLPFSPHSTAGLNGPVTTTTPITGQLINDFMLRPPAIMALDLGLQASQVRQAIRNNLQDIGRPFRSVDSFIQQVLVLGQTSFIDGDGTTLNDILRREEIEPMSVTRTTQHRDLNSEGSSYDNDSDGVVEVNSEIEDTDDESNTPNQYLPTRDCVLIIEELSPESTDSEIIEEEIKESIVEPEKTQPSHSDIIEENRRLKEARLCKICLDQELGVVMLPCAHLVACIACASSLPDCPLCRQTIKATVRTFLS